MEASSIVHDRFYKNIRRHRMCSACYGSRFWDFFGKIWEPTEIDKI
jgi:hypothetical protein